MATTGPNIRRTAMVLSAIVLLSLPIPAVTALEAGRQYTFAVVPQFDQRQLFAVWRPIVDELAKRTGLSFELVSEPKIPVFERKFLRGSYDFAYMNPYHFLKASKSQGYVPLARDRAPLRGILVVRKDSAATQPSDLNGKVVAFPSPNALGASLLMRADLARLHQVNISPLYVKTHDSVYLHVAKGLVDAGGGVQKTLEQQEPAVRDALRIIYTTRSLPSHPVAAHPRVPKRDREKVRRALLDMATAPEGRMLLGNIPMKQAVSASPADYAAMQDWGLEAFWGEE